MDREFLTKHNLTEAHKQFMRLSEGYLSTVLSEAGDDEAPNNMPQDNQQPPMDEPNAPAPNDMNGPQPPMQGEPEPNAPMDDQQPPMPQDNPMPPAGDMDAPEGPLDMPKNDMEPQEKDEVVSVDDITNAQEKLNKKENELGHDLGQVDNRIDNLMGAVEKMKNIIVATNKEITSLKAEMQKRMPTETEKLNLRGLDSYPFNVNPTDFMNDKNKEGRYSMVADNQTSPQKELAIRQKDVDDYNPDEIEKSFDEDYDQTMEKIFKNW